MLWEKKPSNGTLDFFLGALGLLGFVIQLVRQNDNEIHWKAFIGGVVAGVVVWLLMFSSCLSAVSESVDDSFESNFDDTWDRGFAQCHYDAMTDMSLVVSGSLGNSRSDYYSGNVCY